MTELAERAPPAQGSLSLLGGFSLVVSGTRIAIPIHAQRVLAYLSLVQPAHTTHLRAALAEQLWTEVPAERSQASLRTALWRIRQADPHLVRAARDTVELDEQVEVDVRLCVAQAGRLVSDDDLDPGDTDTSTLRGDLLPRWDEDWLLLERERIRQVQIHALEALARRLCGLGRHLEAIDAAFAAIAGEPLRESAHATLMDIFLAEGNVAQALHQFEQYAAQLWSELAIHPTPELAERLARCAGGSSTISAGRPRPGSSAPLRPWSPR